MTERKLPARIERFIVEYAKNGFNGTAAAIAAGYSEKTAAQQASRLLRKVKHLIDARSDAALVKAGAVVVPDPETQRPRPSAIATLGQTLRLVTAMAFGDVRKLFDNHGNPIEIPDLKRRHSLMVSGFEIEELFDGKGENRTKIGYVRKYKLADRAPYVNMLMRHHRAYPDSKELPPPTRPPAFDPSQWSEADWEQFKALYRKARPVVIEHGS